MRKLLVVVVVCALLSRCGHSGEQESVRTETAKPETGILKQASAYHTFSDPASKDLFLIRLVGDSVQTATVTFEIRSSKGKQLYEEKFKAIDLINYDLPENASPKEWDEFILNRIATFFNEENFKTPAINPNMTFDPYYADKAAWDDIKSDSSRTGFYYLLGKEDGRWIAYSKPLQKVVLYYNCC